MSETPTSDGKNKILSLKGKSSTVRQSFSHGRSKSVVVETKRKRVLISKNLDNNFQIPISNKNSPDNQKPKPQSDNRKNVPDVEVNRRIKALESAKALETSRIEQEKLNLAARERELKELRERKEKEQTNKKLSTTKPEDYIKETSKAKVDQSLAGPLPSEIPLVDAPVSKPRVNKQEEVSKKNIEEDNRQTKTIKNPEDRRRSGKLTISQALTDGNSRHRSIASMKRRQEKEKRRLQVNQSEREKL